MSSVGDFQSAFQSSDPAMQASQLGMLMMPTMGSAMNFIANNYGKTGGTGPPPPTSATTIGSEETPAEAAGRVASLNYPGGSAMSDLLGPKRNRASIFGGSGDLSTKFGAG